MVLDDEPEFEVVGEAREGSDALLAARELTPDVVLLDVNLPDMTGFELAPRLAAEAGHPDVVLISSRVDETYAELAREAGAKAFVPKEELTAAAIRRVLD